MISAPQWAHRAYVIFYRVSKKSSVKADLAIYSHIVDASGQCMSASFMLGFNLDFSSWDNLVGFCKSGHISLNSCPVSLPSRVVIPYWCCLSRQDGAIYRPPKHSQTSTGWRKKPLSKPDWWTFAYISSIRKLYSLLIVISIRWWWTVKIEIES